MRNRAKKVVLYNPNPLSENRLSVQAPLALLAISGILDREGYEIHAISDCLYQDPSGEVLKRCENAICLGITCMTGYQITDGLKIAKLVRKRYPELPIVWGGWHPSLESQQTLESPYVDIVVRGQGERTFTELVHYLEEGKSLHDVLGISHKENGKIFHNPDRPVEDINNFPPYPFHLIDVEKCLYNTEYGSRVINYVTSYGCPFGCTFCEVGTVYKRRWFGMDATRIVDDLEKLVKNYKIDGVAIHDNNFFVNKKRVRRFCEEIIRRELRIRWYAYGQTKQLSNYDEDLWRLMKESGLHGILVGAESGLQEMLDFINKGTTVEDTISFARKCQEYGVKGVFSFFIGLPWYPDDIDETKKQIEKEFKYTIPLIDRIISMDRRHRILLFCYTPYPGSQLYYRSLRCGLNPPEVFEGWSTYLLEKTITPWMPQICRLIEQLTTYIFFFTDLESYSWVTERVKNRFLRFIFKGFFRIFEKVACFRWKHKFFAFPVDFWIYRFVKNHGKSFGFYQS
jgi:anaerobic magnesium-protoporphyrin IX monomethyl ester cyclase